MSRKMTFEQICDRVSYNLSDDKENLKLLKDHIDILIDGCAEEEEADTGDEDFDDSEEEEEEEYD